MTQTLEPTTVAEPSAARKRVESWLADFEVHIPRDGDGPVIVERDGIYHAVQDANSGAWSLIWSGCAGLGARS